MEPGTRNQRKAENTGIRSQFKDKALLYDTGAEKQLKKATG
jgi:hypothetical protein